MDFELVFFSEMTLTEWGSYLDHLFQKLNVGTTYCENDGRLIRLGCAYFTFFLDIGEELGMDYYWDEFLFKANIEIGIQIFTKTFDIGIEVLFKILSLITNEKTENFMLLDSNGIIIIKREADIFYKNDTYKEYGKYGTNFPYNLFGEDIKEV